MDIFLIIVVVLLALGAADLVVGVSNDAVNFTNSAVGSRAASRNVIMIVAAIGILFGALSSSGMMEVARKGLFHPDMFTLQDIMFLFTAVMITDIILLDLYNTLGLPTSTTVSLVFELLGSALAIALWKTGSVAQAFEMINSTSALKIISGIVISIVVAFTVGMIVHFFVRLLFTFDVEKNVKRFGGVFAGFAISVLLIFILTKGLKTASFLPDSAHDWITGHQFMLFAISAVVLSAVAQFLIMKKYNVFRVIILLGTGALAMAFAGNDLVNFIGVPVASLNTFHLIQEAGNASILGTGLAEKVPTQYVLLVAAAVIMIVTLWISKKAQTVTKTEISLASQKSTVEVFGANPVASVFVQIFMGIGGFINFFIPASLKKRIDARFQKKISRDDDHAFDLLRASVNILTASFLIILGTSLKLPLSTTFVTFMVAMGTSLSDRAWGRENAVYRVSGVLTVVGGWFMTAIIASLTASLVASIVFLGKVTGILVMVGVVIALVIFFNRLHKRRESEYLEQLKEVDEIQKHPDLILEKSVKTVSRILRRSGDFLTEIVKGFATGKRKHFKNTRQLVSHMTDEHIHTISQLLQLAKDEFKENDMVALHAMTNVLIRTRNVVQGVNRVRNLGVEKLGTYQMGLTKEEADDIGDLSEVALSVISEVYEAIQDGKIKALSKKTRELTKLKEKIQDNQISRIKKGTSLVAPSISYLMFLDELVEIDDNLLNLHGDLRVVLPWLSKKTNLRLQKKDQQPRRKAKK